jgi:hypothetical protein
MYLFCVPSPPPPGCGDFSVPKIKSFDDIFITSLTRLFIPISSRKLQPTKVKGLGADMSLK